ncbi:hypothetical protein TNCV_4726621 [Trichonephila clavipes]|nr:hypothetical protein TNCV_4726621 [Trichonephila clavipes]
MHFPFLTRNEYILTKKDFPIGDEQNTGNISHAGEIQDGYCIIGRNDNVCTALIMADKDILEFVHSSKNIIDADLDDQNDTNNAAPGSSSSEMMNIIKTMHSYIDSHSNGEINNKMEDIK